MNSNSLSKEFIRYVSLNVLGMIGLSCYILADTFFVARGLGANGLAALNLAIPVYSFIHGSGLMLGMGGATKFSISKSRDENGTANQIFVNTLYAISVIAVIFVILGLLLSKNITSMLGADEMVFSMTNTYLKVILLFAPAFMMNDVMLCFVRNDGNPRLSMLAMLGGSLSNVILDYVFIFPLKMGMFGAVFATGLAPVISLLILSQHWLKKTKGFHLIKTSPKPGLVCGTLSLGFPSLVTEVASGIVIIVFNIIIMKIAGNIGVAAYGVIANLSLVVIAVYTGIAQGSQPLFSRAHGSGDKNSVGRILRYAMTSMLIFSAVIYTLVFFFAGPISNLFNSEGNRQLQEIASTGLKIYFTAVWFAGFNVIISVFFTSTEKAIPAHLVSILRGLIIIVPVTFLLSHIMGIIGVWLAFPITELIVAVIGAGMLLHYHTKKKEMF